MNMLRHSLFTLLLAAMLSACSHPSGGPSTQPAQNQETKIQNLSLPVILAFGDSLTAGHGVEQTDSYPAQLQRELDRRGFNYRLVNAGVSGDTTSGGLSRIDSALASKPKIVIVELGANDGMRGLPVVETKRNLEQIVARCQQAGASVVLAGMTLPLNYGEDYIHSFEQLFPDVARQYKTVLMPFFLEDVAAKPNLNQEDFIHPTAAGYTIIVGNLMRYLEPMLQR